MLLAKAVEVRKKANAKANRDGANRALIRSLQWGKIPPEWRWVLLRQPQQH
jgi:hypothetical protein